MQGERVIACPRLNRFEEDDRGYLPFWAETRKSPGLSTLFPFRILLLVCFSPLSYKRSCAMEKVETNSEKERSSTRTEDSLPVVPPVQESATTPRKRFKGSSSPSKVSS